jgi:hypothetical protein
MSTVNSRSGKDNYSTASPGNKRPGGFWGGGFGGDKSTEKNTGAFRKKDPGLTETRNDRKNRDCPFCG